MVWTYVDHVKGKRKTILCIVHLIGLHVVEQYNNIYDQIAFTQLQDSLGILQ
jgi:hypothetical protein